MERDPGLRRAFFGFFSFQPATKLRHYHTQMNWFRRKPTQERYVEAAVTVASNLYLHTIRAADEAPEPLEFALPDSRYRYMIFCVSVVLSAALAYDENKDIQPDFLWTGCMRFLTWLANEQPNDYFEDPKSAQHFVDDGIAYLKELLRRWSQWPNLEKAGKNSEINDLISFLIRTTESDLPPQIEDMRRLSNLALEIECRMPAMYSALVELARQKS